MMQRLPLCASLGAPYERFKNEFFTLAATAVLGRLIVGTRLFFRVAMLPREEPDISRSRRMGSITGPVILRDSQGLHSLNASVWTGPNSGRDEQISIVEHEARFILLVEKNNIFELLCANEFPVKNKCLLASGNGYPGSSFRQALRRVHDQIALPFYVLADNDPAGYELFFLVARGTARSSEHCAPRHHDVAIPDAAYIGLRTRDYQAMSMGEWAQIDLNDEDRAKLDRLASCRWLRSKSNSEWQDEFREMARRGFKVELEATDGLSKTYLADAFLPDRIAAGEHLRFASVAE